MVTLNTLNTIFSILNWGEGENILKPGVLQNNLSRQYKSKAQNHNPKFCVVDH